MRKRRCRLREVHGRFPLARMLMTRTHPLAVAPERSRALERSAHLGVFALNPKKQRSPVGGKLTLTARMHWKIFSVAKGVCDRMELSSARKVRRGNAVQPIVGGK